MKELKKLLYCHILLGPYICIKIKGVQYKAHRLAWLYTKGYWPKNQIDHINHNNSDNRIVNLRDASHSENQRNAKRAKTNTSGYTGVHKSNNRKWVVRLSDKSKSVYIGTYSDINKAIEAREKANRVYGYHKNHGQDL